MISAVGGFVALRIERSPTARAFVEKDSCVTVVCGAENGPVSTWLSGITPNAYSNRLVSRPLRAADCRESEDPDSSCSSCTRIARCTDGEGAWGTAEGLKHATKPAFRPYSENTSRTSP